LPSVKRTALAGLAGPAGLAGLNSQKSLAESPPKATADRA